MLRRSLALVLSVAVATGALLTLDATAAPQSARALSGSEFDAGYIISDANFYNGQAMTSSEIQSFLDGKIGSCLNSQCLNVAVVPVANQAERVASNTGNLICSAFSGGNLRVSELIYRVQVACGISAKVVLVTLQKEQGLITSRAPSAWALNHAMGMACPDTAPCDSAFAGLGQQIITGTAQLKTYKAGRFAKQPGVQYIQYNPNTSCGGTTLNVRNFATAALYSYTPYQPNAAALANLGGVGDSCSTYGNRNFWAHYSNWFGSPMGDPKPSTNTTPFLAGLNAAGELLIYVGNGRGGWAAASVVGNGWDSMRLISIGGDFDGDGNRDILAVDTGGSLWLYPTNGYSEIGNAVTMAGGWGGVTSVLTPGDLTGDLIDDVVAVDGAGVMTLHPGNGRGGLGAPRTMAGSWSGLTSVLSVGDFDGDRVNDLMSIDSAGGLWLHRGDGLGEWQTKSQIGTGWTIMNAVLGARDFDGDGATDLLARRTNGDLWLYRGDGHGGWRNGYIVGNGWSIFSMMAAAGAPSSVRTVQTGLGDFTGDGLRDILAADNSGGLLVYHGASGGNIGGATRIPGDWTSTTFMTSFGDFDNDGFRDLVSVDAAGDLWIRSVKGGTLGTPVKIGGGFNGMIRMLSPGDFNGDGIPDLIAVDAAGDMWLYAGPHLNVTKIGTGFNQVSHVVAGGDFDRDGAVDLLVAWPSGDFYNYRGDGAGSWADTFVKIGNGWTIFDALIGPGDVTGDSIPDLLARKPNGDLWLYPSNGQGDWKPYRQVGTGWSMMRWIS